MWPVIGVIGDHAAIIEAPDRHIRHRRVSICFVPTRPPLDRGRVTGNDELRRVEPGDQYSGWINLSI